MAAAQSIHSLTLHLSKAATAPDRARLGTDALSLFMHLDVFGSYMGSMKYQLTAEGKLAQTEEVYVVDTSYELTVVKELPVTGMLYSLLFRQQKTCPQPQNRFSD